MANGSLFVFQNGDRGHRERLKSDFTIKFLCVARTSIPLSGLWEPYVDCSVLHFSVSLKSPNATILVFYEERLERAQQTPIREQVLPSNFVRHDKTTTKQYGDNRHLQPREKNKGPSRD